MTSLWARFAAGDVEAGRVLADIAVERGAVNDTSIQPLIPTADELGPMSYDDQRDGEGEGLSGGNGYGYEDIGPIYTSYGDMEGNGDGSGFSHSHWHNSGCGDANPSGYGDGQGDGYREPPNGVGHRFLSARDKPGRPRRVYRPEDGG